MNGQIVEKIDKIRQDIPDNVRLVAVTKQISVAAMREAYHAGIRDFAENRLQEALNKQAQLQDLTDVSWHFIGHLQTNKAKKAVESFEWIHSVDSLKLAIKLNQLASELVNKPKVFLQVKILADPNKYGWDKSTLWADLPKLNQCDRLKIRGLMTILPLGLSPEQSLAAFEATKNLSEDIKQKNLPNINMEHISMGMSGDYLLAIKAGATMIRLGTIIFGSRNNQIKI